MSEFISRGDIIEIFKSEEKFAAFIHDWGIDDKPVFSDLDLLKMNQILKLKKEIFRYMDRYTHVFHDYVLTEMDGNQYVCIEDITGTKISIELLLFYESLQYSDGMPWSFKKNGRTYVSGNALNAINNITRSKFENVRRHKDFKTYIMYDRSLSLYKIGKAINPRAREKTLQGEKPDIELILTLDLNIESQLHKEFKSIRVRGEWFSLSADDILKLIEVYGFKRAHT